MADILALAKDTANMEEGRHRLVFIFGDRTKQIKTTRVKFRTQYIFGINDIQFLPFSI